MDNSLCFVIDNCGQQDAGSSTGQYDTSQKEDDVLAQLLDEYQITLKSNNINLATNEKPTVIQKESVEKKWIPNATKSSGVDIKEILKKSVITPEFENLHSVPAYNLSDKKLRELRKKERAKTKGSNWFGMPATEMTDEVKNDLKIIQMRSVLDPKHFYKKNDLKVLPKYFHVGKVMDSPLDHYNNRLTRKERKRTLVDELLADAEFNKYNKRKYREIIAERQKTHYKAYRQAKKLKRKKNK